MKFLKEKLDQYGKPALLWICSYKIFQSWAYPEMQSKWMAFIIDDLFFKALMWLVKMYSAYIVFIVYSLDSIPLDSISLLGLPTHQPIPLTAQTRTWVSFLFWVPGPHDVVFFCTTLIEFLTDLSFILTTLPQLPWVVQKIIFLKIFNRWVGPIYEFYWTRVFDWFGFNAQVEANKHNLFVWLLLHKPFAENPLFSQDPYYPLVLLRWRKRDYDKWRKDVNSLPPIFRLIYEIKDMKSRIAPKKSVTACCVEFYTTFLLWEKSNVHPQQNFNYLFNYNKYLMARFIIFSNSYDQRVDENKAFNVVLTDFGLSTAYSKKIQDDRNWGTNHTTSSYGG